MPSTQPKGFFITGTDTNAGKTTITKMLVSEFIRLGYSSIGCKPISCVENLDSHNHDGVHYLEVNSIDLPLSMISPVRFNLPVSPNIAAKASGKEICLKELNLQLRQFYNLPLDYIFFEGIGGWRVPVNDTETVADLVKLLQIPVILVVGLRVGCLNLAMLTMEALIKDNMKIAGWIANVIEENTPVVDEHIATLQSRFDVPYLGMVPHLSPNDNACHIDIRPLI